MANQYKVVFAICSGFLNGEIVTDDDLGGPANSAALLALNAIVQVNAPSLTDAVEATVSQTPPVSEITIPDASNSALPSADP